MILLRLAMERTALTASNPKFARGQPCRHRRVIRRANRRFPGIAALALFLPFYVPVSCLWPAASTRSRLAFLDPRLVHEAGYRFLDEDSGAALLLMTSRFAVGSLSGQRSPKLA